MAGIFPLFVRFRSMVNKSVVLKMLWCESCGQQFLAAKPNRARKFCSLACASAAARKAAKKK